MTLKPACAMGYTEDQVEQLVGSCPGGINAFWAWMEGQTMALCQGRSYDHETGEYVPACGGVSHGPVVYAWDVNRYLRGGRIID